MNDINWSVPVFPGALSRNATMQGRHLMVLQGKEFKDMVVAHMA